MRLQGQPRRPWRFSGRVGQIPYGRNMDDRVRSPTRAGPVTRAAGRHGKYRRSSCEKPAHVMYVRSLLALHRVSSQVPCHSRKWLTKSHLRSPHDCGPCCSVNFPDTPRKCCVAATRRRRLDTYILSYFSQEGGTRNDPELTGAL